jgi:hypothetical protein
VYPAGVAANGDFACEFNLIDTDVIQMFIGGGGGGSVIKRQIHAHAVVTSNSGQWISWGVSAGPNNPAWGTGVGANTSDPTLARWQSGWIMPVAGTLTLARIYMSDASAGTVDHTWELWKIALTDGGTTHGTQTELADVTYTQTVANQTKILDMTLTSTTLAANDCLVLLTTQDTGTGHALRLHDFILEWEET